MKKYNRLETEGEVNISCPLSYYPRPLLKRSEHENLYMNLNGVWKYEIVKTDAISDFASLEFRNDILVPYAVESPLSMVERRLESDEYLIYRKEFTFCPEKNRTILHFGAVDNECEIYLNGNLAGSHIGGYLPFSFDVTDYLEENNTLIVKVRDRLDHHHPYGKQRKDNGGIWYTPVSGIWKTVWLESVDEKRIEKIDVNADADNGTVELLFTETECSVKKVTVSLGDKELLSFEEENEKACFTLPEVSLWSPKNPALYTFTVETETDRVESYFALRKIELKYRNGFKVFYLNNEPLFMHGLLDQGYYPDGIYTPKALETVLNDLITIKELGFNTLRKHIKIEDETWYYLCDRMGIIVWQDFVNSMPYDFFRDSALPTVGIRKLKDKGFPEEDKEYFIQHSIDTINHLRNHPSIVLWTIFNEGWGQFDTEEVYERIKVHDDTRIFDVTSGWFDCKSSSLDSRHVYFKPVKITEKDERALVISEFGGYSLATPGHMYSKKTFGYKGFKDRASYNKAFFDLYMNDIVSNIDKGVCASIYTQVSDVEEEINGIMTYDRAVVKLDREVADLVSKEIHGKFKG
ncbi:MAG: glycoside hydrolase family 2 [Clostridia bacterium]|nr:glycoside hydrolase family 2 [Clostridia bacterium]